MQNRLYFYTADTPNHHPHMDAMICCDAAGVCAVAGPEADVDVFGDAELYVIPANETLTFEHTYTWWGKRQVHQPHQTTP
jgi:hypothetical protein